jgi:hypothetical protein
VLSKLVVLFPTVPTVAVFPLIAITLGNNLATQLHPAVQRFLGRRRATACRLLAAVPPLALTLVVSDLTLTLRVAGLAGLVVAFFIPAALQWASVRASSAFLPGAEQIGAYFAVGRFLPPGTPGRRRRQEQQQQQGRGAHPGAGAGARPGAVNPTVALTGGGKGGGGGGLGGGGGWGGGGLGGGGGGGIGGEKRARPGVAVVLVLAFVVLAGILETYELYMALSS